jgi:poly(hydroxyalkanoate) depolymerase family esterase
LYLTDAKIRELRCIAGTFRCSTIAPHFTSSLLQAPLSLFLSHMPLVSRRFMHVSNQTSAGPEDQMRAQWIEGCFGATGGDPAGNRGRRGLGYRLYLPPVPRDGRLALLVMLHGCKQNALIFAEGTRMNCLADAHGFGVLYPEQSSAVNPLRCWNWFDRATLEGDGEAGLIARLVDYIATRHPIDRARLWVAGMSAGAAMARILAVRHAALFAACAVHSGVMYRGAHSAIHALATLRSGSRSSPEAALLPKYVSERRAPFVPTLVIHGDRDTVVNPVNAQQIVEQARLLAVRERSGGESLAGPHERRISGDGRSYMQRDYSRTGAVLIREIVVEGLAHAWSGGDARHPHNDAAGPSATQLIWDFVSQHRRQSLADAATVQEGACGRHNGGSTDRHQPLVGRLGRFLNDLWSRRRR